MTDEQIYYGEFDSWSDVQAQFDMTEPEPYRVVFADYDSPPYDGCADVLWQNEDGTFCYVSGGHCSCYGLEGQWQPETLTSEYLAGLIAREPKYGLLAKHSTAVRKILQEQNDAG